MSIYIDENGKEWAQIAENEKEFFIVPVVGKMINGDDFEIEYDYTNIKGFAKEEPDYPLEKRVSYSNDNPDKKKISVNLF